MTRVWFARLPSHTLTHRRREALAVLPQPPSASSRPCCPIQRQPHVQRSQAVNTALCLLGRRAHRQPSALSGRCTCTRPSQRSHRAAAHAHTRPAPKREAAAGHTCPARPQQRQALAGQRRARARVQHLRAERGCSPAVPTSSVPRQRTPAAAPARRAAQRRRVQAQVERGAAGPARVPTRPMRVQRRAPACGVPRGARQAAPARRRQASRPASETGWRAGLPGAHAHGAAGGHACFIFSVRWSSTWQVMPSHARSAGYCTARPSPPEATGALLMHTQRSPVPSWPGRSGLSEWPASPTEPSCPGREGGGGHGECS